MLIFVCLQIVHKFTYISQIDSNNFSANIVHFHCISTSTYGMIKHTTGKEETHEPLHSTHRAEEHTEH